MFSLCVCVCGLKCAAGVGGNPTATDALDDCPPTYDVTAAAAGLQMIIAANEQKQNAISEIEQENRERERERTVRWASEEEQQQQQQMTCGR